jgi:hypothetical protein
MRKKLALIPAFLLLLCGSLSAQAFNVFQDPTASGTNTGRARAVPTTGELVILNLYVEGNDLYGWELEIKATGGMELTAFDPNGPDTGPDVVVVSKLTQPTLLRANRVDPTTPKSGPQRIGKLTVRATEHGSVNVTRGSYVSASLTTTKLPPIPITLASTLFECGDVSGDGEVTSFDAVVILRHEAKLPPGLTIPGNCDVNNTSDCSSGDAVVILREEAHLPPGVLQSCPNAAP